MRLNETSDEFANIKHTTSVDKLNFAQRRLQSLSHQYDVIDDELGRYKDRLVTLSYSPDLSDAEKAKGFTGFKTLDSRGRNRTAVYHSLTPRDIQVLTPTYKKMTAILTMTDKLEKTISTLKRNASKEAGTYVSQELLGKLGHLLDAELTKVVQAAADSDPTRPLFVSDGGIRTRTGRGDIHIFTKIADVANPGPLEKKDIKPWKARMDKIKDVINVWLQDNGLHTEVRISFGYNNTYARTPTGTETVKMRSGSFEVRLRINALTDRYKKLGKW